MSKIFQVDTAAYRKVQGLHPCILCLVFTLYLNSITNCVWKVRMPRPISLAINNSCAGTSTVLAPSHGVHKQFVRQSTITDRMDFWDWESWLCDQITSRDGSLVNRSAAWHRHLGGSCDRAAHQSNTSCLNQTTPLFTQRLHAYVIHCLYSRHPG